MQIEIEFIYQGQHINIQCNTRNILINIFHNFANKAQIDINSVYFLYSGTIMERTSTVEKVINNNDKERKKMSILVNNKYYSNQKGMIIKSKDISCPKCGEPARINIKDYKILLQCKSGHNKGNILFDEYKGTQKLNISKIICNKCNINSKSNTYKNVFFRCYSCNMDLCPLCKDNHNNEHKIINYDDKNYRCVGHNKIFNSYCKECEKNLCLYCEQEHNEKKHKIINYINILPKINNVNNDIKILKDKIDKFKTIINDIIIKLKKVEENIEYFYDINKEIINSLNNNNINYEILYNYNKIKDVDIINDINKIINNELDNHNIINILDIYTKMTNKYNDEIIINYNIIEEKEIKLFGKIFVENNKDNCKIIIEDKEYELIEKYKIKNIKNKSNNIFSIKLKGIQNITNMSYMFSGCDSVKSLPDISNWNIANANDTECSSLNSLPDISNWNTTNDNNTNINSSYNNSICISTIDNKHNCINRSSLITDKENNIMMIIINKWNKSNYIEQTSKLFISQKKSNYPSCLDSKSGSINVQKSNWNEKIRMQGIVNLIVIDKVDIRNNRDEDNHNLMQSNEENINSNNNNLDINVNDKKIIYSRPIINSHNRNDNDKLGNDNKGSKININSLKINKRKNLRKNSN